MKATLLRTALVLAAASGCGSQISPPDTSARVTIDGTHQTAHITCSQWQQYRTVEAGDQSAGLEATVFDDGVTVTPLWVKVTNFGGFTGSFWKGGVGSANARLAGHTFTIDGSVYGVTTSKPKPATTNFTIVADCR